MGMGRRSDGLGFGIGFYPFASQAFCDVMRNLLQ